LLDHPGYQDLFRRFREAYAAGGGTPPILFPLCLAHFEARQRILEHTLIAGRPLAAEQLAIWTSEALLWDEARLQEAGLEAREVKEWVQKGFCAYRMRQK
jgi:hypothetical protein